MGQGESNMETVQIARTTTTGRFQDRDFTGTAAEVEAFLAEYGDWTVISRTALTAADIEAREIRAEWRGFRAQVSA
jgi:hypothetical protein